MQIGICSYSFHRTLEAGKQDIFGFIDDCKKLGCTQLDPWNGHFPTVIAKDREIPEGVDPEGAGKLTAEERELFAKVKAAGDAAGMPHGIIAVDGAHVYDDNPEYRKANRARAYRWIEACGILGAKQMRLDSGGPKELSADQLEIIREGYEDIIARAKAVGVQVLIENHWGPSPWPDELEKILDAVPELGFLHDTHNWAPEKKVEGRERFSARADALHIKTLNWDEDGNEVGEDLPTAIRLMKEAGYSGAWGIESTPREGDEFECCAKSIALIKRLVG